MQYISSSSWLISSFGEDHQKSDLFQSHPQKVFDDTCHVVSLCVDGGEEVRIHIVRVFAVEHCLGIGFDGCNRGTEFVRYICDKFASCIVESLQICNILQCDHDTADFLDKILTEQPYMEAVQLQFNYLDYDDPTVQSKACYDVAVKHGKKVIVMEPVKGGALANLPEKAALELSKLGDGSQASHAIRFAMSYHEVFMVLSGIGSMDMMRDNISTSKKLKPLTSDEKDIYARTREIIREVRQIPCTKCNYCAEVCPSKIPISEIFEIYNGFLGASISRGEVKERLLPYAEKIDKCVKCGRCEGNCPQSIEIREMLEKIRKLLG